MIVSDSREHSSYITYLYNAIGGALVRAGGTGELIFGEERVALRLPAQESAALFAEARERIAEIIRIGYKYEFLNKRLQVFLSLRVEKLLFAALIASAYDGDKTFIRRKVGKSDEYAIDGFYAFRFGSLREKWERIAEYIPDGFASEDLKKFCEFLGGESKSTIYL